MIGHLTLRETDCETVSDMWFDIKFLLCHFSVHRTKRIAQKSHQRNEKRLL